MNVLDQVSLSLDRQPARQAANAGSSRSISSSDQPQYQDAVVVSIGAAPRVEDVGATLLAASIRGALLKGSRKNNLSGN